MQERQTTYSLTIRLRIRMSMCISVKKFQRTKFDVSQKPLIQKMHRILQSRNPELDDAGGIRQIYDALA